MQPEPATAATSVAAPRPNGKGNKTGAAQKADGMKDERSLMLGAAATRATAKKAQQHAALQRVAQDISNTEATRGDGKRGSKPASKAKEAAAARAAKLLKGLTKEQLLQLADQVD
jgi:hypothetical protein